MTQKRTKTHWHGAPRDFGGGRPLPAAQEDSNADSDADGWTRLAFITDVHADVHALHDALRQIERLGCDLVVCAGDLLDWGLFPEETLSVLRDRRIPCIRGNHDRWAVEKGQDQSGWDLTRGSLRFLEALPMHWAKVMGGARIVVWHARPGSDTNGVDPGGRPRGRGRHAGQGRRGRAGRWAHARPTVHQRGGRPNPREPRRPAT